MTEKEKMLAGELYKANDPQLTKERHDARNTLKEFNDSHDDQQKKRARLLHELFAKTGENLLIEPPFFCDYGSNITIGNNVFFNFNCVILDVAEVRIGNNVFCGPNVQMYTATHPLDFQLRREEWESGEKIEIGDDVWIGGGSIICPGVKIGARSVIGAGSVVTKDVPPGVLAFGNPCSVIRELE